MTPQETQGAIWGGGQHGGASGELALLGAGSCRAFVHRVGDSSALGGHPCHDGGHQDDTHRVGVTTGWVSPLGAAGSTGEVSGPFPNSSLPGVAPSCAGLRPAKITGAVRRWLEAL